MSAYDMNERYDEDEYLMLSGIQHFTFCRRQWALIHLEGQWQENILTVEGKILHEKCHDEKFSESRGDVFIMRGLRVTSASLGVNGQCDVVEFHKRSDGCGAILHGKGGSWDVVPVEYKRGKPKEGLEDVLQLCGEAICLEEMLSCEIPYGFLFYGEPRRRHKVEFTQDLRQQVRDSFQEMHNYFKRGYTPKVKTSAKCRSCSIKDLCLPKLCKNISVSDYYCDAVGADD